MAKDFDAMEDSNRSGNPSVHGLSDPDRREWLRLSLGATLVTLYGPMAAAAERPGIGFRGVPASRADTVVVPDGYLAQAIAPWGEPAGIAGAMPAFRADASNSAGSRRCRWRFGASGSSIPTSAWGRLQLLPGFE